MTKAKAQEPAVCTPKRLPDRLRVAAARTAIRHNPANAPAFGPVAMALIGVPPTPERIAVLASKYWGPAQRRLTVSFVESTAAELRAKILSHMNAWAEFCGISFAETGSGGQVRVSRGKGGYWSYLGTDILHIPARQQTMNLEGFTMKTPESEYLRVVRHETGHSLGFPHEHMRREIVAKIDAEKAISYFKRTQGWDADEVREQVLTALEDQEIPQRTDADEASIMCYQLPGSVTKDGRPILGGSDIDPSDSDFAARIYPKADVPPPPPPASGTILTVKGQALAEGSYEVKKLT
jgi:hypothetical protein